MRYEHWSSGEVGPIYEAQPWPAEGSYEFPRCGGCIRSPLSDQRQMAGHSDDDHAEALLAALHAHGQAEKLFVSLGDPMRRAARQGIGRSSAVPRTKGM